MTYLQLQNELTVAIALLKETLKHSIHDPECAGLLSYNPEDSDEKCNCYLSYAKKIVEDDKKRNVTQPSNIILNYY